MSTKYSIGQMNQLADALELGGFTTEDVTALRNHHSLADILSVVRGQAKVVSAHIINCDDDPFIPEGWELAKNDDGTPCHIKGGLLEWNPAKIKLYLSKHQQEGVINGNKLRKELKGQTVLNACVLDYLLAHTEIIPEEWKGKVVFFWGTIYRDSGGHVSVRYLRWGGSRWDWSCGWLGSGFGGRGPAAVSASI